MINTDFADIPSTTKVFLKKPKTHVPAYKGKGRRPEKLRLLPDQSQPQTVAELVNSKCLNEHRSWPAWHRHMIYVSLALHFFMRLRIKFKKNSVSNACSGQKIIGGHFTAAIN